MLNFIGKTVALSVASAGLSAGFSAVSKFSNPKAMALANVSSVVTGRIAGLALRPLIFNLDQVGITYEFIGSQILYQFGAMGAGLYAGKKVWRIF